MLTAQNWQRTLGWLSYLRKEGLIIEYCKKQRQQQFICTELFLFAVKRGTPPDVELEKIGVEIAKRWEKLGRRLGVSDATLSEINQARDQLSEKGYHMLKHWKQNKGSAATYQALCDALRDGLVQRLDLAEKFCYIKGNYFMQYNMWV